MASKIKLDADQYYRRLSKLHHNWTSDRQDDVHWKGSDAFVVMCGKHSDELVYKKSATLTLWLWSLEVPNAIFVFVEKKVFIFTTAAKIKLFSTLNVPSDAEGWDYPVPELVYIPFLPKDKVH
tara:strand:+ start:313 stop:681 length:369 start_codon:yes stop_codon:yes gene_type:complete